MKLCILLALVGLFVVASAEPINVFKYSSEDLEMEQDKDDDDVVTGSYSWTSPEGTQFFVRYIADDNGFRIVDSNALPVSSNGVRVDGSQGSFKKWTDDDRSDELFD